MRQTGSLQPSCHPVLQYFLHCFLLILQPLLPKQSGFFKLFLQATYMSWGFDWPAVQVHSRSNYTCIQRFICSVPFWEMSVDVSSMSIGDFPKPSGPLTEEDAQICTAWQVESLANGQSNIFKVINQLCIDH